MKKKLYELVGLVGTLLQPGLFALVYRYVILSGWSLPFFAVLLILSLSFVCALAFVTFKTFYYENPAFTDPGTYFDNLLLVGIFQTIYLCCSAYAFQYPVMSLGRYFVISTFIDLLGSGLISTFLMFRDLHYFHWVAAGLSVIGYLVYDFMFPEALVSIMESSSGKVKFSGILYKSDSWAPFICVLFGRIAYCFRGVFHKHMLLMNHFCKKYWALNTRLDLEEKMPINRQYLDDTELACPRKVSTDSGVIKWARHFRHLNKINGGIGEAKESVNVGVDDYVKYLLEMEQRSENKRNEVIRGIVEKEVLVTGNTLYRHLFYLRNKIATKEAKECLNSSNEKVTQYEPVIFPLLHRRHAPNLQSKSRSNAYKTTNTTLESTVKDILDETEGMSLHLHLFTGYNDLFLTKLDLLFSSSSFDNVLFEFSEESHYLLHCLVTILPFFVTATILAILNNEIFLLHRIEASKELFGSAGGIALVIIFALISVVVPYANFHSIMSVSPSRYHWFTFGATALWISLATGFVDNKAFPLIPPNWVFGLALCFIAKAISIHANDLQNDYLCFKSNLELVKATLTKQFEDKMQLKEFVRKAQEIEAMLGPMALHSLLLDTLVTGYFITKCTYLIYNRNKQALEHSAPPVLPLRSLFDPSYNKGGKYGPESYYRPAGEIVESTWHIKDDGKDNYIEVAPDPMLQGIALSRLGEKLQKYIVEHNALILKYEKEKNFEEKKVETDNVIGKEAVIRIKAKDAEIKDFVTIRTPIDEKEEPEEYLENNNTTTMQLAEERNDIIYDFKRKKRGTKK